MSEELHECLGCGDLVEYEELAIHDKRHFWEVLEEFGIRYFGIPPRPPRQGIHIRRD